ncbi:ABC transporter permease [Actinocatenispora comari]|uniref:L-arabinose ABC transporter permease n=1 Tax=Actinocatenispora comari TaxID=2807577 RepID=A0A8J4A8I5_9ACTN|nr:ABC transporter permease [Actinocatenispora comari]GIL26190.1 L-arabinose ABC transporter permease [Actinocatenispora comari]
MPTTLRAPSRGRGTRFAGITARTVSRGAQLVGKQNLGLLAGLALLLIVIRTQTDRIFLIGNLFDIGVAISILGILAVAEMVVIVAGGLDISIGSTASLTGVTVALLLKHGAGTTTAILLAIAVGLLAGALNGAVVVFLRINPIITTLASFSAFAGLSLVLSHGLDVPAKSRLFDIIAIDELFGIPYPLLMLLVFALLTHLVLRYTVAGRHVYAMGSNADAARNTGINLASYRMGIYLFSGLAAAIGGIMTVARDSLAQANTAGADQGLIAITAALLGGAALTGGRGAVPGALLGVIILGVLDNGLILMQIQPFYSQVAVGVLLVVAVGLQQSRILSRLGSARRKP